MAKNETERINVNLPPELGKPFNDWIMEYVKLHGNKYPHGIKIAVVRLAVREFLKEHKKDFPILEEYLKTE